VTYFALVLAMDESVIWEEGLLGGGGGGGVSVGGIGGGTGGGSGRAIREVLKKAPEFNSKNAIK
jgi:hypothetical protein